MNPRPDGRRFRPLTEADARAIAGWRYDGPWAVYDAGPDDLAEMLAGLAHSVAAVAAAADLVGFLVFGAGAEVAGGRRAGLYPPIALDVGLGLRPDLVGRGGGTAFVRAGLAWACRHLDPTPTRFRLSVAAWNIRAIRAYEGAGFARGARFGSASRGTATEFLLMTAFPSIVCRDVPDVGQCVP